jgi:type III secretion protein L
MIIQLDPHGTGLLVEHGIVRANELGPLLEATALMDQARHEAEAALARAAAEGEALVEEARVQAQQVLALAEDEAAQLVEGARLQAENAHETGYQSGEQLAAQHWHERHAQLLNAKADRREGIDKALAEVVMQAVRRIVDTSPRENLFLRALKTVQGLAAVSGGAALRVAPDDADAARAALAAWPEGAARGWSVQVEPDPALKPGSSIFSSEIGTLDASLESQLSALNAAMGRAVQKALVALPSNDLAEEHDIAPTHH